MRKIVGQHGGQIFAMKVLKKVSTGFLHQFSFASRFLKSIHLNIEA